MKKGHASTILIVALVTVIVAVIGFFIFIKITQEVHGQRKGLVPACVIVSFKEEASREEAKSLFRELNITSPKSFYEDIKKNGAFVPEVTINIPSYSYDKTITLLKKDPRVVYIQPYDSEMVSDRLIFVYVLFVDSITFDQAYQLLKTTYMLPVTWGAKIHDFKIGVPFNSENSIVESLKSSKIVRDAYQCKVEIPSRAL